LPPFNFIECIEKTSIPVAIKTKLKSIIEKKKTGCEKDIEQNIVEFDNFIEQFLKEEARGFVENKVKNDLIERAIKRLVLKKRNT